MFSNICFLSLYIIDLVKIISRVHTKYITIKNILCRIKKFIFACFLSINSKKIYQFK